MKKRPEYLKALAERQARESWDYADRFCALLPEVMHGLREEEHLSMYELQLRTQVQRETTSKVESKMQLPSLHVLARIAYVLAGTVEGLAHQVEVARREAHS